jgi:hypothetical protein
MTSPPAVARIYTEFDWLEPITDELGWQMRLDDPLPTGEFLWHYTSLSTFQKIIETGVFHLNRLDRMNDSEEGQWLSSHLNRVLSPAKYYPPNVSPLDPSRIQYPRDGTFAFSLSRERDLLSQWVAYANGGRGVAIGFDPMLLRDVCQPVTTWKDLADSYEPHAIFCEVKYSTSADMEATAVQIADRIRTTADDQHIPSARRYNSLGKSIGRVIRHLDPIFKNKAFQQEREWRITFFESNPYPDPATSKFSFNYRVTESDIVRHYEMRFKNSIKKIMIGPLCRANLEMEPFLRLNGIMLTQADIDRSEATLVAK